MTRTKSGDPPSNVRCGSYHAVAITKRRAKLELRDGRERTSGRTSDGCEIGKRGKKKRLVRFIPAIIALLFCQHLLGATTESEGEEIKISGSDFAHLGPSLSPSPTLLNGNNFGEWLAARLISIM